MRARASQSNNQSDFASKRNTIEPSYSVTISTYSRRARVCILDWRGASAPGHTKSWAELNETKNQLYAALSTRHWGLGGLSAPDWNGILYALRPRAREHFSKTTSSRPQRLQMHTHSLKMALTHWAGSRPVARARANQKKRSKSRKF